ncbi:MAG: DUF4149 domain-containing protein [Planctomycetes bacterium]|nr:DUF4149 domain-containing protein [Planctomycetota bacterium]
METLPFWFSFVTTVVLLTGALLTGWTRKRRLHLWLGPLVMVSLVVTIVLTEELVRRYDFPADVKRIHLWFAKTGGLLALPVILTGVALWRTEKARRWHKAAVLVWLVSVLAATGTGIWMFSHGAVKTG